MSDEAKCQLCGEPMPPGETMFSFHGYSGPCPKPPLLQPHQRRVVAEKQELDDKIAKLTAFIGREVYAGLPIEEQSRLCRQLSVMKEYSKILGERIAAFPK